MGDAVPVGEGTTNETARPATSNLRQPADPSDRTVSTPKKAARIDRAATTVRVRRTSVIRQLVTDLAVDDLAQCGIFGRKLLERFHERTIAALELFHAA